MKDETFHCSSYLFGFCFADRWNSGKISLRYSFSQFPIQIKVGKKVSKPKIHLQKSVGRDAKLDGGGVEGDMIFPEGVNPKSSTRGVAIYGRKKWPNGEIPYDISSITGIEHKSFILYRQMKIIFPFSLLKKKDPKDRRTVLESMSILMYSVGIPIPDSDERAECVSFRPRQSTDQHYIKIQYGNGCSANVCSLFIFIKHLYTNFNSITNDL